MNTLNDALKREIRQSPSLTYALQVRRAVKKVKKELRKEGIECSLELTKTNKNINSMSLDEFVGVIKEYPDSTIKLSIVDRFSMFYVEIGTTDPSFIFMDYKFDDADEVTKSIGYDNLVSLLIENIPNTKLSTDEDDEDDEDDIFAGLENLDLADGSEREVTQFKLDEDDQEMYEYLTECILDGEDITKNLVFKETKQVVSKDSKKAALEYLTVSNGLYSSIAARADCKAIALNNFETNIKQIVNYVQRNSSIMESLKENTKDIKKGFNPESIKGYVHLIREIHDCYDSMVTRVCAVVEKLYELKPDFSLFKEFDIKDYSGDLDLCLREGIEEKFDQLKEYLRKGEL
jgi:hypothetical protein